MERTVCSKRVTRQAQAWCCLREIKGKSVGETIEIKHNKVSCGSRKMKNGRFEFVFVPWEDLAKSTIQAHFTINRNDSSAIENLNPAVITCSDVGLWLNRQKLPQNQSRILLHGDTIETKRFKKFRFIDCREYTKTMLQEYPNDLTEKYFFGSIIGSGLHGSVRLIYDPKSFNQFAMKTMIKNTTNNPEILREVQNMRSVDHPNLLKLFEVLEYADRVYLLTEYMPLGDFLQFIMRQPNKCLNEEEAKFAIVQVTRGLAQLHSRDIVHLDLKLENVLIDETQGELVYKICDFGFSQNGEMVECKGGTPGYISPEAISLTGELYSGKKRDMWSLGVILYGGMSGTFPFYEDTQRGDILDQIREVEVEFWEHKWVDVSDDALHLIASLLHKDPDCRPTTLNIWSHCWFKDETLHERVSQLVDILQPEGMLEPEAPTQNIKSRLRRMTVCF